ncbi:NUDIX hydrolase [Stenotrophomonas maltophilia]|uniref:NUDIX hydrolase n=1 Tax=Stenotrophomonas maltophilia TaxID=40324 RepID=A0A1A6XZG2_STEMA|nr:NUDIX hydrolase [Stenotrophomonas maltophilia]OBU68348.1 NUDIX hydrolase [Stenotrophomonas maltophilia]
MVASVARWMVMAGLLGPAVCLAAPPAVPASARAPQDDYTILRLLVTDDQGRLLLERNPSGWMTPAVRANRKQSLQQALRGLAAELGLQISAVRLAGIFSYRFNEDPPDPAHDAVSFRQHYRAELRAGQPPAATADKAYRWVTRDEAAALIGMPSLRMETLQVLDHPGTLWGGAFELSFEGDKATGTRLVEPFYPLR